jgi:proteasome lid subunit RPN8/RPN11
MFRLRKPMVSISFSKAALESIFDECDRYEFDETGGKIIGTYEKKGAKYKVNVRDVIDPGPRATRSPTSLFQDGEYQEKVFRAVEQEHPEIEHLGSWHTHHVNGLPTLSSGDRATYQRIVNHDQYNLDFFYAFLVVRKTPGQPKRYEIKHYFVYRNDNEIYEIPEEQIQFTDFPRLIPNTPPIIVPSRVATRDGEIQSDANIERVNDQRYFSECHPNIKPAYSKGAGALYWKGKMDLVDGSQAEVLVMEDSNDGSPFYSVTIAGGRLRESKILEGYNGRRFKNARGGVFSLLRDIDREMFRNKKC